MPYGKIYKAYGYKLFSYSLPETAALVSKPDQSYSQLSVILLLSVSHVSRLLDGPCH